MVTICINDNDSDTVLHEKAAEIATILSRGGVMAFPADTVWGLGTSAISPEGLNKIRRLKKRKEGHPFPVYIDDISTLDTFASTPDAELVQALAKQFWPGSLTMVLPLKAPGSRLSLPCEGGDTLGFRVPDSSYLRLIAAHLKAPVANTSANLTGEKVFESAGEIENMWKNELDVLIRTTASDKNKEPSGTVPSTVIGIKNGGYEMFREGKISGSDLDTILAVVKR